MKNFNPISENAIENHVRISNEWNDVNPRPIVDLRRSQGILGDVRNDTANSCFDSERDGYSNARLSAAIF
jgi:hypothetical protein